MQNNESQGESEAERGLAKAMNGIAVRSKAEALHSDTIHGKAMEMLGVAKQKHGDAEPDKAKQKQSIVWRGTANIFLISY